MQHLFISYRRSDQEARYLAHMISGEIRSRYGPDSVFLDVDFRTPGSSFPEKLDRALKIADAVLVIIGPSWLQLLTERIRDKDWVRHEISESLKRDSLPIVPICRSGVEMPRPHELPEELQELCLHVPVLIDPFQEFEAHLARSLSDLENRVEALRRRSEELQVARGKLISIFRWRALQLEKTAAHDAATAQAAERVSVGTKLAHFFISYSDQEGRYLAYMISRKLRRRYGSASVFLDVDSEPPDSPFGRVDRVLNITDVVLVIIGPLWLQQVAERAQDPWDGVRYEICESLKRRLSGSLDVVPVCRNGVEMPREHELPSELQSLSSLEAVSLDPFQELDAQLASFLSYLENIRRQKEELQVARGRLMSVLRGRVQQLKLDSARHAAARREAKRAARKKVEAAVRAAQAKAEVEEQVFKWIEEARLAEQVAGRAPGAAASSKAPQYYQHSNRYTSGGVVLSLLASGLVIFGLAFGYSYSLLSLPFVQLNFFLTFFYGLFCSFAAALILQWHKVRNPKVAALVGLASGLAAVYLSWAVWVYGYLGLFKKLGFNGFLMFVASPVNLWHYISYFNEVGSWDIWGYKPTGFVLWVLWSLEAILLVGLSSLFPPFMVIGAFCETCGNWCTQQHGANLRHCDLAEFKQHLRAKDLAYLAALGGPPLGATRWLNLSLSRCVKCGTTNTLDAKLMVVTTDGKVRSVTEVEKGLLLSSAECTVIEKIGREAEASAKRSPSKGLSSS